MRRPQRICTGLRVTLGRIPSFDTPSGSPWGCSAELEHFFISRFVVSNHSRCVAVASFWPNGRMVVWSIRSYGRLATTLRLLWYLSKACDHHMDALSRPCVIISQALRQPQDFCLHKFKIRRAATLT